MNKPFHKQKSGYTWYVFNQKTHRNTSRVTHTNANMKQASNRKQHKRSTVLHRASPQIRCKTWNKYKSTFCVVSPSQPSTVQYRMCTGRTLEHTRTTSECHVTKLSPTADFPVSGPCHRKSCRNTTCRVPGSWHVAYIHRPQAPWWQVPPSHSCRDPHSTMAQRTNPGPFQDFDLPGARHSLCVCVKKTWMHMDNLMPPIPPLIEPLCTRDVTFS